MTGDEHFRSRHFVPDGAACPGEPVVVAATPQNPGSSVAGERRDAEGTAAAGQRRI